MPVYLVIDISVMRSASPTDTEIARLCYAIVKTICDSPDFGLAMCRELWDEYLRPLKKPMASRNAAKTQRFAIFF